MKLYNTETKSKQEFVPLNPQHVTMYVCGPTVYNFCHIGNFRPAVVFDVLARLLRRNYPKLTYVRNITDIDDKINAAAEQLGVPISDITTRYTAAYHSDLAALGVLAPDVEPKVTEHVAEIHHEIQALIERGHAYVEQGHVLFSVSSFAGYGELSKRDPEELLAGARVDVAAYKRSAGDFVLWKPSSDDQPGWDSPWGRGRPGWHIECTAMAARHLGATMDIHGGGHDLIFPHHENERAQSVCAHDAPFVRYWLHNGFVNVNREKMSKSIGNVLLVKDLLTQYSGEAIRYVLLAAHYRAPLDWSDDVIEQANSSLDRLYGALRKLQDIEAASDKDSYLPPLFIDALEDDLNTPKALAELFSLAKQANISDDIAEQQRIKAALLEAGSLLGLLQEDPESWFSGDTSAVDAQVIEQLISDRAQAKADKNWARADEIRDELNQRNVVLEDGPAGTIWRIEN
ncbi:cysteine--tRNA ligase [Arenicella xantha]|uniref:Cysteine--tRNA ligase n=1 Tax=Arenicella xantha TaxID=644221 RepID=A0A395JUN5_9GAMM|nr:cysteine--tRNA ligase [Arenicella xantha]RBP53258.1 cysteinyl-tRNA synthetase [Arenicella xantha]